MSSGDLFDSIEKTAEPLHSRLQQLCDRARSEHIFPGCTVAFDFRGVRRCYTFGHVTYADDHLLVPINARYDIASLTKLFVATTALRMINNGLFHLSTPVRDVLGPHAMSAITVEHLLSHTSGLSMSLSRYRDLPPHKIWDLALSTGPQFAPGTQFYYSNQGYLVLGKFIETVAGDELGNVLQANLFSKLGLVDTCFGVNQVQLADTMPTEIDSWRGRLIHGEVNDEIAFSLGGAAGHAGLFSTANDLLDLAAVYLESSSLIDDELRLRAITCRFPCALSDSLTQSWQFGYAWRLHHRAFIGKRPSTRAYGFVGFTGPSVMGDPEIGLVVAILNNRTYPDRQGASRAPIHSAITDAIFEELGY